MIVKEIRCILIQRSNTVRGQSLKSKQASRTGQCVEICRGLCGLLVNWIVILTNCERRRVTMPLSKTGAGPGLNGDLSPLKKIKNNPRPGQNLVLKIDWTGADFSTKQRRTGAKLIHRIDLIGQPRIS